MHCIIFTDITDVYPSRSVGAYRISTELRDNGYTCDVVDYSTTWSQDELLKYVDKMVNKDTLVVGFSTTFFKKKKDTNKFTGFDDVPESFITSFMFEDEYMYPILQKIKEKSDKVKIVVGGASSGHKISYDLVDFFILGYADIAIVELVKFLDNKENNLIVTDEKIINAKKYYDLKDFDKIAKYQKSDFINPLELVGIEISRGCIFKCPFCAFPKNGKKRFEYVKPKEILLEEMKKNYYTYGISNYVLADDTFNDSVDKIKDLEWVVNRLDFSIEYSCYLRLDLLYLNQKEYLKTLVDTGLKSTLFGIETLNPYSMKVIRKNLGPEKTKDALQWVKSITGERTKIASGFIVGLPGENIESVYKTQEYLLSKNNPLDDYYWFPLWLQSLGKTFSSDFELTPQKYGYKVSNNNYNHNYTNWENEHFNFTQAMKLAQKLSDECYPNLKISSLSYLAYRNAILMKKNIDTWTMMKTELPMSGYFKNSKRIIDEYKFKKLSM